MRTITVARYAERYGVGFVRAHGYPRILHDGVEVTHLEPKYDFSGAQTFFGINFESWGWPQTTLELVD